VAVEAEGQERVVGHGIALDECPRRGDKMPCLRFVVIGPAALRVERLDDDGNGIAGATVFVPLRADPERADQFSTTVQPSGQPIRRSHSTGVRRRTDEVPCGNGLIGPSGPVMSEGGVERANDVNAASSSGGSILPRFVARRRMPRAARADSENRGGALGRKTSVKVVGTAAQTDDEDPSSALGHSEVASVENPKRPPVPEFRQSTAERRHVSPSMTGEEARYVFEEDGGRSVALHKVEEGEGESAALSGEACPLPSDGEVLTGEAAGPENSTCPFPCAKVRLSLIARSGPLPPPGLPSRIVSKMGNVAEVRNAGPSPSEDSAGVGIDFGEADGAPSSTLKPKVGPSDTREEGGMGQVIHRAARSGEAGLPSPGQLDASRQGHYGGQAAPFSSRCG